MRLAKGRPPRNRGTREQKRALDRYLRTAAVHGTPGVVSDDLARAVLAAVAAHVDGAGYAYLEVETVIAESGVSRRSVYRCLDALERDGLMERIPTQRTKGGRGQGATTYRLGAAVRAAVGLRETEWAPEVAPAIPTAASGSLAHPGTGPAGGTGTPGETLTDTPGNGDRPAAPTGTPGPNLLAHPDEQEESALDARSTGTPERFSVPSRPTVTPAPGRQGGWTCPGERAMIGPCEIGPRSLRVPSYPAFALRARGPIALLGGRTARGRCRA
jgi:hypothetical protein